MKAITYRQYGAPEVLQYEEIAMPVAQDNEVLVKVRATALNAYDWRMMRADPFLVRISGFGFFKPKNPILGIDIAGEVEAVGSKVTRFKPGDAVYGDISGIGIGGLAEYVAVPEERLAPKPKNLSFAEAAAVPMAAVTALQGLRDDGALQPGQKVAINGASGGVGTFAVQLAKLLGAEVTAVTSSGKQEMARALGADHVIDYTREDFTNRGEQYDVILAVNGFHSLADYRRALTSAGRYVMIGGKGKQMVQALLLGRFMARQDQKMGALTAKPRYEDLLYLKEQFEAGKLRVLIDRTYPLREAADAFRYIEQGHAAGKVVIMVDESE